MTRTTTGRPFASDEKQPILGQVALWVGKVDKVIYSGTLEIGEDKYSVSLFYPKGEYTKALYSAAVSKNFGSGWETLAYIDFIKSKSPKLVSLGFFKWKGDKEATYRILLFKNENPNGKENAPKFKGILVANERDKELDTPTPKNSVKPNVKPAKNVSFAEDLF